MAKKTTKAEKNVINEEEIIQQEVEQEIPVFEEEEIAPVFPDEVPAEETPVIENIDGQFPTLQEEEIVPPTIIKEEEVSAAGAAITMQVTEAANDVNQNITVPVEIWKNMVLIFKGYRNVKEIITIANNSDGLRVVVPTQALVEQIKKIVPSEVANVIYSK